MSTEEDDDEADEPAANALDELIAEVLPHVVAGGRAICPGVAAGAC